MTDKLNPDLRERLLTARFRRQLAVSHFWNVETMLARLDGADDPAWKPTSKR